MLRNVILVLALSSLAAAQHRITISAEDGGLVCADLYGRGTRAVVLAHGGRFSKESWRDQAKALDSKGFRVLAIDFPGRLLHGSWSG
jgi:pimeloyl-ACP methyl ester carboxylesterase